jgi:hypothetical protein
MSKADDLVSKMASQVGSVAPSLAPTKSMVSKLDKIEEVAESPQQKNKFEDIKT